MEHKSGKRKSLLLERLFLKEKYNTTIVLANWTNVPENLHVMLNVRI